MNTPIYIAHSNCITPLGFNVAESFIGIKNGISGITLNENSALRQEPFYAGVINTQKLNSEFKKLSDSTAYTRLEKMMVLALQPVIENSGIGLNNKTALIVSTTKGNIAQLEVADAVPGNIYLHSLAKSIAGFFGFATQPVVLSNACVSGILAVSVAKRLILSGLYDNVFIIGADEVSEFVLSGFNSFQAMSSTPCRPYAASRDGMTLGEAAAAALITKDRTIAKARIAGDGSINDANHISGPSRTGEGLYRSIEFALKEAGITPENIDYISAHGTATLFNDEMEAMAFNRAGLENIPLNSLKGYFGHTLGASGLLEAVLALEAMEKDILIASLGFDGKQGMSLPLNIIIENTYKEIQYFLKTASGFGGCNAAVVFEKVINGK